MEDTLQSAATQTEPLKTSKLATWCLAVFLAAAALEVTPILAAKIALAPLPKSAGESYAFSLVIAFSIMAGLALQVLSVSLALIELRRTHWKGAFGCIALACNTVMAMLFILL